MEFEPSLIGCFIWSRDHSRRLVRESGECVINLPTADMAATVVRIRNTSGRDIDKFDEFGLTAETAVKVQAPLIAECFANFECKVVDDSLVAKYSVFVLEVVKAHVAKAPRYPRTIHHRGDGVFIISGANTARYRRLFRPNML